ncbi:class I SAM-dependent methyltransferase [Cohnella yongneupensis]|uniref:Class I SAM-dependent methyltransferase n=1 Tax=Cohnella yongneupensis TaxID=425006 RepID=A0ABW0QVY5_9BACL
MSDSTVCPVCGSYNLNQFLNREGVPANQNLLIGSKAQALSTTRGTLNLVICKDCKFIFNSSFSLEDLQYGSEYDNTQSYSPYFNSYINNLIRDLVDKKGIRQQTIVEVGCGKGGFLRKLVEEGENIGFGFDPSYDGEIIEFGGRLRFEKKYYDEDCTSIQADVVISRHVIEHVPDPVSLLKTLRKTLKNSPNARVFFETRCVEWILKNRVMYDFFYEQCSYFSKISLSNAFQLSGFEVVNVEHIFNGQYLWIEAVVGEPKLEVQNNEINFLLKAALEYVNFEKQWRISATEFLEFYSNNGKLAIWGAGAKGVTFLNLLDPNINFVNCVIDINPNKVGKYIPGSGHEIISIEELCHREIGSILILNPNYFEEISVLLKDLNLNIKLFSERELMNEIRN